MRSSTQKSTRMMNMSIDTCSSQELPTSRCLVTVYSSRKSGAILESNNLEDGFTTKSIDQSHSSCYLEDPLEPIPRLAKSQITIHSLLSTTPCWRTLTKVKHNSEFKDLLSHCEDGPMTPVMICGWLFKPSSNFLLALANNYISYYQNVMEFEFAAKDSRCHTLHSTSDKTLKIVRFAVICLSYFFFHIILKFIRSSDFFQLGCLQNYSSTIVAYYFTTSKFLRN